MKLPFRKSPEDELESLRIQGIFNSSRPGNVSYEDVRGGDSIFDEELIRLVKDASDEFGLNPGLLGSHFAAEIEANDLNYDRKYRHKFINDELGLDDWVKERKEIQKIKSKKSINEIPEAGFMYAESRRGEANPTKKYLVAFPTLEDAVRACAKYIKYKQNIARSKNNIGKAEFDKLIPELKLQLSRLLVNPGDQKHHIDRGTKYWISQVKNGTYENLFDFSDRSYKESGKDVKRRATIHTARAIHIARAIFGVEP